MTEARIHGKYGLYEELMDYCGHQGASTDGILTIGMSEDMEDFEEGDECSPEECLEAQKFGISQLKLR